MRVLRSNGKQMGIGRSRIFYGTVPKDLQIWVGSSGCFSRSCAELQ